MSAYKKFVDKWKDGCGLECCQKANKICLARGQLPCDILFVGEAPGESENVVGVPFCGPSGKALDNTVANTTYGVTGCGICQKGHTFGLEKYDGPDNLTCQNGHYGSDSKPIRIAFTNVVGCIPRDGANKASEPEHDAIVACSKRLVEFVKLANPRLIVCVGKVAMAYLDQKYKGPIKLHKRIPMVEIVHPGAILRANFTQRELLTQKNCVIITDAIKEYLS